MNLKVYLIVCIGLVVFALAGYKIAYHNGWNEGRQNLVQQQAEQARAKLAKQTIRQQADDSKAAAADDSRKANTEVITRDVIKYIKTRDHSDCEFPAERVRIKSAAADNAACLAGFDDCSVRAGKSQQ